MLNQSTDHNTGEESQTGSVEQYINHLGRRARDAARLLATAPRDQKDRTLREAARELARRSPDLLAANAQDVAAARDNGRPDAFLDRLSLDEGRVNSMVQALEAIATLPDPVGRVLMSTTPANGLDIQRVATPIGVIGMIYESRPNVGIDAGALCLKSGNAIILRGGSDSRLSSQVILEVLQAGLAAAGLPEDCVQVIDSGDRRAVGALLRCVDYVDLVIPRGGRSLVSLVRDEARVPTLLHLDGNCHSYVHRDADLEGAIAVIRNAKLRRTGICGATESLVVDAPVAEALLPRLIDAMEGCSFRGDERAQQIDGRITAASEEDWDEEYLSATLSVRVVADIDEALEFVARHSSGHTDAILTENAEAAERFLNSIDSAVVMHNASTQFSDGGEFGMGAEIGIATGKLHARGPVGLEQLTTFKYQVRGSGQILS